MVNISSCVEVHTEEHITIVSSLHSVHPVLLDRKG